MYRITRKNPLAETEITFLYGYKKPLFNILAISNHQCFAMVNYHNSLGDTLLTAAEKQARSTPMAPVQDTNRSGLTTRKIALLW